MKTQSAVKNAGFRKPGFTTQVVLSVILGILFGLFFGESIEGIGVIGTTYVRLLQMTILPYIMVSLIHGFGGGGGSRSLRLLPSGVGNADVLVRRPDAREHLHAV